MSKINAGFRNMLSAKKAIEELKKMGYKDAHLDAGENFFEEYSEEINLAGTKNAPSLSALVLRSRGYLYDVEKAPLIAADPMVSGTGCFNDIADNMSIKIIVNVKDEDMEKVKGFLKESGGHV